MTTSKNQLFIGETVTNGIPFLHFSNQSNTKEIMTIEIGTPRQIFATIGRTELNEPVAYFLPEREEQAISDLTNYFSQFDNFLSTGVQLTEAEYRKFLLQFQANAKDLALKVIGDCIDYNSHKFCFLPPQIK